MKDDGSLNQQMPIFLRDNNADFSVLAAQDCTMSQDNPQEVLYSLCEPSMKSIWNIPTMGDGG